MRDLDIRMRLQLDLRDRFPRDLIRNEMGLCLGETRVDLAVVNGHLHGYEIKSDRDTLARLSGQVALYDRVLDYSTLVCGSRHRRHVESLVPRHWGLIEARELADGVVLDCVRRPTLNRSLDKLAIAQLLWRDEAAALLTSHGERVRARETRWDLWDRIARLPLKTLQSHVRAALKERQSWPGG